MKRYLLNSVTPLAAAGAGWFLVPILFWQDNKTAILAALSVIVAAVMVRLARGLPFTNADHFEVAEIRDISAAIKQVMRSLVVLLVVALGTMFLLIFGGPAVRGTLALAAPSHAILGERGLSAVLGLLVVYVLLRIFQVAQSDYGLVELQSKFMIRAVERKAAEKIKAPIAPNDPPLKTSEGYGRMMQ